MRGTFAHAIGWSGERRQAAGDHAASPCRPPPAGRPEGHPRHWPGRGAGPRGPSAGGGSTRRGRPGAHVLGERGSARGEGVGDSGSGGRSARLSPGPDPQSARRWRPGGAATARDHGSGRDGDRAGPGKREGRRGERRIGWQGQRNTTISWVWGGGGGGSGHDTRSYRLECGTEYRLECGTEHRIEQNRD